MHHDAHTTSMKRDVVKITDNEKQVNVALTHKNGNWLLKRLRCRQDSAYSWIALIAGFILVVSYTSTGPMFGILFAHKIKNLDMSTFNVALTFNFQSFVWNLIIIASGPLSAEFGWRKVGMFASFITSVSIFTASYATSKIAIYSSFSLLSGLGGGLAFSTSLFVVSNYFLRRRGLAMALLCSGIGVGQLVPPLFVRYLQENYGFHNATLIYSSFLLFGVIAAMFFSPLEEEETSEQPQVLAVKASDVVIENVNENQRSINSSCCRFYCVEKTSFVRIFKSIMQLSVSNVRNLKSPVVALLSISAGSKMVAFLNIMLMLPLSLESKGLSLQDAAYCFSITGVSSILSRVIVPALSDFKAMNTTAWYITGEVLVAASCFAYTFTSNFSLIAICFGILGAGMGMAMSLHPIIIIEYKGVAEMPRTYGSYGFVCALHLILLGPTVGYIRDITGSYVLMYRIFSGMLVFAALIWSFMPFALADEAKIQQSIEEPVCTKQ